jgi:uroporphyrinogen decarboxylase
MSGSNGMTGKELLFTALRHEPTPAVPWVPYAGVHAAKLIGVPGDEILRDGDLLLKALMAVHETYDPDGQPVAFDLQIEAEILGCELMWPANSPPSVVTHPFAGATELPTHLPAPHEGRLPMILKTMQDFKAAVGEQTALFGLVTGPLTLASHLRGTEIFVNLVRNPDYAAAMMEYCGQVAIRMADLYIDAGMDVIAIVDPVVSQISAKHFNAFLSTPFSQVFDHIRQKNVFSSFFVCGDATRNLEVMCQTGPDSIAVDENLDMEWAKEVADRYNITLGGNIPLSTVMLLGTQQDNMKWVVDFLDKLNGSNNNYFLAPGCDMPFDTPVENTVGVAQAVRDREGTCKALENYKKPDNLPIVEMPDYPRLGKPLVEVFTIDSATCAACGYMTKVATLAAQQLNGKVDMVEHKITEPENVSRVMQLGITNLPAILINGELKYSSIIPSLPELLDEINKYMIR